MQTEAAIIPSPNGSRELVPGRNAVILQPSYLPWLGYFAQMYRSDVFVVYDDVQYDKHSWRNRNRIKTPQGVQWITVPVRTHGCDRPNNREVAVDNAANWRKKHLASLRQNYARSPFFGDYIGLFERLYGREWNYLIDLNLALLEALAAALGLRREIRLSSELGVEGERVQRLIDLCKRVGATKFYEGAAGRDYIDDAQFTAAGLAIEYQDYRHPVYPQLHGDFVPYLSVVDLLFNCGPKSLEVLAQ